MATFLVTGGAGFIGSHLAERLLGAGQQVIVLDDLSTGSERNLDHLRSNPGLEVFVGNVANEALVTELVDRSDSVFHLAAAVGVRLIVESPVRTIETNVNGTELILRAANRTKKPVLLTSTSEVYGKATKIPFSEDDDLVLGPTVRGRWAYACSKALDEFLALAYFRERGLPVVVARLFNTVGPRQTGRYGMVVPSFVSQALAGEPITVFGNGRQRRCFCYVGDVVGALVSLVSNPRAWGSVFNIGSEEEVSVLELAERIKMQLESPSRIVFLSYDEAYGSGSGFEDMSRRVPDLRRIRNLLGFEPRTRLAEIIDQVAQHCRVAA